MRTITVVNNVSVDGVMQAPGRADEDERDGFTRGGWAQRYGDQVMAQKMAGDMHGPGAMLFGRRTYEDFFTVWPHVPDDNPFKAVLNESPKYVASTTLAEPLPWANSILLDPDAMTAIAKLKAEDGPNLTVLGSGVLVRSLLAHHLVDELVLSIHPLLLRVGRRLFDGEGEPVAEADLELVEALPTTTGVIIATYRVLP